MARLRLLLLCCVSRQLSCWVRHRPPHCIHRAATTCFVSCCRSNHGCRCTICIHFCALAMMLARLYQPPVYMLWHLSAVHGCHIWRCILVLLVYTGYPLQMVDLITSMLAYDVRSRPTLEHVLAQLVQLGAGVRGRVCSCGLSGRVDELLAENVPCNAPQCKLCLCSLILFSPCNS